MTPLASHGFQPPYSIASPPGTQPSPLLGFKADRPGLVELCCATPPTASPYAGADRRSSRLVGREHQQSQHSQQLHPPAIPAILAGSNAARSWPSNVQDWACDAIPPQPPAVTLQSPTIIMTGLKLSPCPLSFKLRPLGQLHFVLLCIGMLQTKCHCPRRKSIILAPEMRTVLKPNLTVALSHVCANIKPF
jgi:hypothetical protein